jgi:ankyrin repeat protein
LEIVEWLHKNRKEGCTTWAMDWAARNGHLEVVEFLHKNRNEGCTHYAMEWAAMNGNLEVVEYLRMLEAIEFSK